MKKYVFIIVSFILFCPGRSQAQHPVAVGSCFFSATCAFGTNPSASQMMIAFAVQSTGTGSAVISDTYGLGAGWTQFSCGYSTGTSNVSTAWWAKTGAHSGPETITVTWSGSGTNQLINLVSYSSSDADVTATGGEDYCGFHANANNTCASTLSISYTLTTSGGGVMENEVVDTSKFTPSSGSATGPTMNAIGGAAFYTNSNSAGTVFLPITAGSYTNTFSWSFCSGGTAVPFMYIAAVKGTRTKAVKHKVKNIYN